jgi:UDP-N-acetylmuramyl pentapeptide phosphotransferase/UDP-N-acetylglucosamine-1-phosphate transferase
MPCLLLVTACTLAGVVDDVFGSGENRGLVGHAAALVRRGTLTTGILKAVAIVISAALSVRAAAPSLPLTTLLMDAAIVALAANLSNLLDLRPGRAAKAYVAGAAALSLVTGLPAPALVPVALAGAVLAGMKDDLREGSMLGDAGSNPLGAALGYWVVLSTPLVARAVILVLLGLLHAYSERHSLTALIERNSVLRFLDGLGRR